MSSHLKSIKHQPIQVFARVRPLNRQEGRHSVVDVCSYRDVNVKHHGLIKKYNFDRVFGPDSTQLEVYKLVAEPTVAEVLKGYNCTVLAYGQTGTGKTYTMAGGAPPDSEPTESGLPWAEDIHAGIIPRTICHLFDELRLKYIDSTVRVSYIELYNEDIFDLLAPIDDYTKLRLYDDTAKKGSVIVQGLIEQTINCKYDVYRILDKGAEKRRVASTLMNNQSSRSHTVFCITVHTKEPAVDGTEDLLKIGKLYLVDLAGSENIKQSGSSDVRVRETMSINQSLLTLGRCIVKLMEREKHIPYRESKLTRILQDSLGGRTKTTLIATVSPASGNIEETLNTLEYATRAKCIQNKPEVNQCLTKRALMKEYTEEIERLRKDLAAARMCNGVYIDKENYEALLADLDGRKSAVIEKVGQIQALKQEKDKLSATCDGLQIAIRSQTEQMEAQHKVISTLEQTVAEKEDKIDMLSIVSATQKYIIEQKTQSEQEFASTAKQLLSVADTTTADQDKLHDKLETLADITKQNKEVCEQHINDFHSQIEELQNTLADFRDKEIDFHKSTIQRLQLIASQQEHFKNNLTSFSTFFDNLVSQITDVKEVSTGHLCATRSFADDYKEQLDKSITNGQSTVYKTFMSDVKAKILMLLEHSDAIFTNLTEATDHMRQSMTTQQTMVEDFVFRLTKDTRTFWEKITQSFELLKQNNEAAVKNSEEAITRTKEMQDEYDNELEDIIQRLTNMKSDSHHKHQVISDNFLAQRECAKSGINAALKAQKQVDNMIRTEETNAQTFQAEMIENLTRFDISDILSKIQDNVQNANEDIGKTADNCEKAMEHFNATWDDVHESYNNGFANILQHVETHVDGIQNGLNTLEQALHSTKEEITSTSIKSVEEIQDSIKKVFNDVITNEHFCVVSTCSVCSNLDASKRSMCDLVYSSLKDYKPTGQTPMRKRYNYPTSLPTTKSPELLAEEFIQKAKTIQEELGSAFKENEIRRHVVRSNSETNLTETSPKILVEMHGHGRDHNKPHPGEIFHCTRKRKIPRALTVNGDHVNGDQVNGDHVNGDHFIGGHICTLSIN